MVSRTLCVGRYCGSRSRSSRSSARQPRVPLPPPTSSCHRIRATEMRPLCRAVSRASSRELAGTSDPRSSNVRLGVVTGRPLHVVVSLGGRSRTRFTATHGRGPRRLRGTSSVIGRSASPRPQTPAAVPCERAHCGAAHSAAAIAFCSQDSGKARWSQIRGRTRTRSPLATRREIHALVPPASRI